MSAQLDRVVELVQDVLAEAVVGAYLHGSAVLGGLNPHSDIDVLVVSRRPSTRAEKARLVERLLEMSVHPDDPAPGRAVELTIVVQPEVRPWRFPPRRDFQFGEWWRAGFEAGDLEPWPEPTDPDIAVLVTVVLGGEAPVLGPPPAEVLDPVPAADLERAMLASIDEFFEKFETDTANTLLVLARVWTTLATGEIRRKDGAADWALARLPGEHRPALASARGVYLGDEDDVWGARLAEARSCADAMVSELGRLRAG